MQTITGRLTKQAKVKETKSGKKVTEFTVVLNDSYRPKDQDERVQLSTFYQYSYWGSPKVAPYLKKGTIVTINGRIGASAWISKEGKAVATLTCTVFNLKILICPVKEHTANQAEKQTESAGPKPSQGNADDDDLPF